MNETKNKARVASTIHISILDTLYLGITVSVVSTTRKSGFRKTTSSFRVAKFLGNDIERLFQLGDSTHLTPWNFQKNRTLGARLTIHYTLFLDYIIVQILTHFSVQIYQHVSGVIRQLDM